MSNSLYTALVSRVLFPMHELLKRHTTVAVRRGLEASQWSTPAELEALQLRRLRRLLERANRAVPYYRDLFRDIGFDPARDLSSLADLTRLPRLDKATIRANGDRMKAGDAVGLARFNTDLEQEERPAWSRAYFIGVPSPAGAGLALMPLA